MLADLVIVSSPLQCLNAIEWRARREGPADLVLIGDRAGGRDAALELIGRRKTLWRRILEHPRRPQAPRGTPRLIRDLLDAGHRASLKKLGARLGPRRTIAFGDYRNVSQRALVACVPHDALVLVDDGSVAPQVAAYRAGAGDIADPRRFDPGWLRTAFAKSALGERAPAPPPRLTFFTIYGSLIQPALAPFDALETHAYESWRQGRAAAPRGVGAWLLGSNHVEAGVCSAAAYQELVVSGVAALMREGAVDRVVYRPHRGEAPEKAAAIAAAGGMTLAADGKPAEIAWLDAERRPAMAVIVASSAADTLSVLDPDLDLVRLAPPDGYFRRQIGHLSAVIAGHDAFNPRLRVLDPAAPDAYPSAR